MGDKHIDRILLNSMLRGLDVQAVKAPVAPLIIEKGIRSYREEYVRELWPVVQLWEAANLAYDQAGLAARRLHDLLRTRTPSCHCSCPPNTSPCAMHSHAASCSFMAKRVPLLSELADSALPSFLHWRHPQAESVVLSSSSAKRRDDVRSSVYVIVSIRCGRCDAERVVYCTCRGCRAVEL
jgi:hypothetical protein